MYNHALFLLLFFCFLVKPSLCEPRATNGTLICSNRTAADPDRETFVSNYLATMDRVTPLVDRQGYGAVINGTGAITVYTFGQCMKDLSQNDCNLCFAQCKTQIPKCRPFQLATRGGRNYFDGCYLRYDDYNFFNESLSPTDRTECGSTDYGGNKAVYGDNAMALVRNLSAEAVKNDGFSVGSVNKNNVSVYGLVQCWEFVKGSNCQKCLDDAVSRVSSCTPKEEGRVLNAGCYLRYSTQRFYNNSGSDAVQRNRGEHKIAIIIGTCAGVALLLMAIFGGFFLYRKLVRKRRERKQLGALLSTVNKSKINFSYETLERATNYFHASNKLGQGGSGSVYKGILPDGKTVAIKRLFFNTTQWADHFFNEVKLISGIDHRNLVKLLGCSITGPESLLVYEYVSNQTLHDHLFARKDVLKPLSWEARCKIILGTAEGLAYLHEESKLRIIHRDIKLTNILLDEEFTAKIADFGLARLFPEDKTHISTGIAGTLGYMAPEYAVRGKLSEKADIYSFGIVVFELICGKKNNSFADSHSILQMVWDLYGKGRLSEAVDPVLKGTFQEEEASRFLQIGLLCVQASAELRPPMSVVVKMIENNHEIPEPKQPPFLSHSSMEMSMPTTQPEHYSSSSGTVNSMTQSLFETR